MTTRLDDLGITKVALCAKGMNPEAEIMLFKMDKEATELDTQGQEASVPANETVTKADHDKIVADLQTKIDELTKAAEPEPTADDVLKSLPEAVRDRIEKAEKAAAEQSDRIAKMEQDNRVRDFVRKAKDEYGDLASPDEFGPVLEAVDRLLPEDLRKAHELIVKAVAARADASQLFKQTGVDGSPGSDDDQNEAAIAKYQAEGLSRPDAIKKALAAGDIKWQASRSVAGDDSE